LKYLLLIFIIFIFAGCNNRTELAIERGIQFYEWGKLEEAILEFKYVIQDLELQNKKLKYKEIKLLSRAHHNLAVAYAKKKWYKDAVAEAQIAFNFFPSDDNRKVLELIQKKKELQESEQKQRTTQAKTTSR